MAILPILINFCIVMNENRLIYLFANNFSCFWKILEIGVVHKLRKKSKNLKNVNLIIFSTGIHRFDTYRIISVKSKKIHEKGVSKNADFHYFFNNFFYMQ
jgi:hypothetical protein